MKSLLVVCALVATAAAVQPSVSNYHEAIGIPRAEAIRRAEEAGELNGGRILNGQPAVLGQFPYMVRSQTEAQQGCILLQFWVEVFQIFKIYSMPLTKIV